MPKPVMKPTTKGKGKPNEPKPAGTVAYRAPKRADMPMVSVLNKPAMRRAIELMEEAGALKDMIRDNGLRLNGDKKKGIRGLLDELQDLQNENELPGLRYGSLVFVATYQAGKRTLDKELLLENDVDPDAIAKSYKQGAGFYKKEIVDLNKGEDDDG